MMSLSEFLGVHVLIDEGSAAKLGGLMKCSKGRLEKRRGGFRGHTHWQKSEG